MTDEKTPISELTPEQRLEKRRLEKQVRNIRRKLAMANDKHELELLRRRNEELELKYIRLCAKP